MSPHFRKISRRLRDVPSREWTRVWVKFIFLHRPDMLFDPPYGISQRALTWLGMLCRLPNKLRTLYSVSSGDTVSFRNRVFIRRNSLGVSLLVPLSCIGQSLETTVPAICPFFFVSPELMCFHWILLSDNDELQDLRSNDGCSHVQQLCLIVPTYNTVHHLIQLVFVTKINKHFFYRDVWAHLHNNLVSNRQVTRDFYCRWYGWSLVVDNPNLPDVEVTDTGTDGKVGRKGVVPIWPDLYPSVGVVHFAALSYRR